MGLTNLEEKTAAAEGWGLFEVFGGAQDGTIQIQKLDESDVFNNDFEALCFVERKAETGSELHRKAIQSTHTS